LACFSAVKSAFSVGPVWMLVAGCAAVVFAREGFAVFYTE